MENNKKIENEPWWREGVVMFTKVSAYIAMPIVLALFIGKYLDNRYHTTPWVFLSLTFLAFPISLFSIWRGLTVYLKKIESIEKSEK